MKTVGKRIISWLLAGIIALALIPFMSQTVRADGETPIALTDCKTIGFDYDFSDDGCPMYYINIGEANTTILLSDFDEDSDITVSGLLSTGYEESIIIDLTKGFQISEAELKDKYGESLNEDACESLDFSNLYGIFVFDYDTYDMFYLIIQGEHIEKTEAPFTYDKGTIVSFEEDAYDYDDGWMQFTADQYTLEVPYGTTEINLSFDSARLVYGYDEDCNYVCGCAPTEGGNYADIMSGDSTAVVKVNESNIFPDYVHVQTPYTVVDDVWISDTLYVIKIVVTYQFQIFLEDEELTDITFEDNAYEYLPWGEDAYKVGVFTVQVPKGTTEVTIKTTDPCLHYNYTAAGEYIGGWVKDPTLGDTEFSATLDYAEAVSGSDGEFDYIQIQEPYVGSHSTLFYCITFSSEESPAPTPADTEISYEYGDEYEILTQARAGTLTDENAKTYFESILQLVTENGSAIINEDQPNENAKVVLALTAAGYDATSVAGFDLVDPLTDVDYAKGTYCTIAAYSLLAMSAHPNYAAETQDAREELAAYLYDELGEDGSISYEYGGKTFVSLDSTAMVMQALKQYYDADDPKFQKAGEILAAGQKASGGFTSDGTQEGVESTSTTAQVIILMTEYGVNPDTDEGFVHETASAITYLDSVRTEDGFAEVQGGKTSPLATQQGNLAIAAYQRLLDEKKSFFDMSDVDLSTKTIQASEDGGLFVESDKGIDKDYTFTYKEIAIPDILGKEPNNVIKLYDISVFDADGNPVEIKDNQMTIKLKVAADLPKHDVYKVVYVKDDKIVETMEGKVDGDYLVFKTSHLSEYGVVEEAAPATGDQSNSILYLILAILAAITLAGVVTAGIRKKDNR